MLAGDLLLVGPHERASADDVLTADEQAVDAMRAAQHKVRDEVVGAAELEPVRAPDRQTGAAPRLEGAQVVAPEYRRTAARPESERLARRHRGAPVAAARDEQRLLDL